LLKLDKQIKRTQTTALLVKSLCVETQDDKYSRKSTQLSLCTRWTS
jgi:hypothetical protein